MITDETYEQIAPLWDSVVENAYNLIMKEMKSCKDPKSFIISKEMKEAMTVIQIQYLNIGMAEVFRSLDTIVESFSKELEVVNQIRSLQTVLLGHRLGIDVEKLNLQEYVNDVGLENLAQKFPALYGQDGIFRKNPVDDDGCMVESDLDEDDELLNFESDTHTVLN